MGKKNKQTSVFSLEGRFLGFEVEDGYKLKRLHLATPDGQQCIKLSKEARASVGQVLVPGSWIQVWGEKTIYSDSEVKLKAYQIKVMTSERSQSSPIADPPVTKTKVPAKATILVCQKSDCMKRGGRAVCQALEAELNDRGLTDQVTIKGTGCMKQCKAGPNLVMPDKTRYSRISARDVSAILDQHFLSKPQPQVIDRDLLLIR